ncbi:SpoVR family protein [Tenuibacillus multivorans]|uniref:SpoVR like protein n=1 Tax=Tenuibacillus multivorans TaxID=237069 RepID=A0A1H0EWT4_9BACI|nr:SpoVR family protein [Tenuibacillus multivorans]GEL76925.1 stage V sporulation protein R [Tenuibacillus multivorans]SDN86840.1 SpoVR like protein [Tenuibacillus multivorans]
MLTNDVFKIASSLGLSMSPYEIVCATPEEIAMLYAKGYHKRYMPQNVKMEKHVPEQIEVGSPHIIYLNRGNKPIENLYILAHSAGHLDFVYHNLFLINLRKPRLTHQLIEPLLDYTEQTFLDQFLGIMRKLSMATTLKNRYIAPITYFLKQRNWFDPWQFKLLKEIQYEADYFNAIQKTKLMNEGWAVYNQDKVLQELGLTVVEKLEIAQLEARLHFKPEEGLNYYSLGKALWEEVSEEDQMKVIREFEDTSFIKKYYTEAVHKKENISVVENHNVFKDYKEVKEQLLLYFKFQTLKIYIDQDVTDETGYLTLRYQNSPYQVDVQQIKKMKMELEQILKQAIYIKPFKSE